MTKSAAATASISLLQPADLEAAGLLLARQMEEHEISTSAAALRGVLEAVISHPERGFFLLARINKSEAVGIAFVAAHWSAEHGGTIGWLEELYVAPPFRCRGIGSMLLDEVISRAGKAGWQGLDLEVVAGHGRASALYTRRGFHFMDRQRFHYPLSS